MAAVGLPTSLAPPAEPLDEQTWQRLLAEVRQQRLEGALAHAISEARWPSTDAQAEQAAAAHRRAMTTALVLERHLLSLAERFDDLQLRWRIVKGPALAWLDEPDPSLRAFGDLDLLIHGDDVGAALAVLESLGGRRHHRRLGGDFDRRFGKGAAFTLPDGCEIDLHRTLALGPYGLALDPGDLFDGMAVLTIAGRWLPALDRPRRFLHACYHAALGQTPPRLAAVRDVVQTMPGDGPAARAAHDLARAWRGEAVVATALNDAAALLGWTGDHPLRRWAAELDLRGRDRRWLAAHRGARASSRARTALGLEALPGVRDRVAYALAVGGDRLPRPRRGGAPARPAHGARRTS